jgi:uncharacterized membrane protein SirB2
MLHAYLVLIGVWIVAVALSLAHHVARKQLPQPPGPGNTPRRPNWLHIVFSDLLLFSLIPGVVLMFLFPFLPFSGFRAGLALGLVGILLGAVPVLVMLLTRRERPLMLVVCDGSFFVFKVLVCLGLLGALYPP